MAVRAWITRVFLFFSLHIFAEAELLHMCVLLAIPAVLLFWFVWRGPCVITAFVLCVVPFLLFLMVSMMLLVFGFELFILGLYCSGALWAITLSVGLELFNGLDYFVSGLRPVCVYESFSEALWHLPPQLVIEVVFFHRYQEWVFEALQVSVEVDYRLSLRVPFSFLVAVISLHYACFFWPECIVYGIDEYLPCDVFQLFGIALRHPVLVELGIWLQRSACVVYAFLVRIKHI